MVIKEVLIIVMVNLNITSNSSCGSGNNNNSAGCSRSGKRSKRENVRIKVIICLMYCDVCQDNFFVLLCYTVCFVYNTIRNNYDNNVFYCD